MTSSSKAGSLRIGRKKLEKLGRSEEIKYVPSAPLKPEKQLGPFKGRGGSLPS